MRLHLLALLLVSVLLANLQTVKAQKVVLHMTGNQTFECSISELDSITFEKEADDSDENNKYCNLPARLYVENVRQAPVLFTACESWGEYCTAKIDNTGQRFLFTNAAGQQSPINILAISGYGGYYLGLSGLIIGRLSIPEIGEDIARVVCFDIACSNCYQNYNITKPLTLQTGGYAKCHSCQRTYNLNDCGSIADGPSGRNLYRYRVNYINGTLVVNNG